MIFAFYILAALLIYLSFKSFRGGIDYLNYFKRELSRPPSEYAPFATVIVPCKGVDAGLAENLNAVLDQAYPSYEVIFVVDSPDDRAAAVIQEISRHAAKNVKLIVASRVASSGQKVENLREAVLHADNRSDVFVFADSDVRPWKDWLRDLVAPLSDEAIGAATGYRWFLSENTTFATEFRSAWNASIASALGPNVSSNFCWGGSTAIRREVFERLKIRAKWAGTLSDDFTVTRVLNEAGLPICFVPQALVPSAGTCSLKDLLEFTNRQMKITRVYARKLWLLSFFGSGLFNAVMITSILILAVYPAATFPWFAAFFTLLLVSILSIVKSWLRFSAVRLVLHAHSAALDRQFPCQMTLWMLTPAVFLINCIAALFSTRVTWRGIEYAMISSTETVLRSQKRPR